MASSWVPFAPNTRFCARNAKLTIEQFSSGMFSAHGRKGARNACLSFRSHQPERRKMACINRNWLFVGGSPTRRGRAGLVALKTTAPSTPPHRYAPLPQSPWYDYGLTACALDTSKGHLPDGVVIR